VTKRIKKIDDTDTLLFEEENVVNFSKKSLKFHIAFCEEEVAQVKISLKGVEKAGPSEKVLKSWRRKMNARLRLLKQF